MPAGRPTFVDVMEVAPSLDIVAVAPAEALLGRVQVGTARVAPAALGEEGVPDFDLLVIRAAPAQTPIDPPLAEGAGIIRNRRVLACDCRGRSGAGMAIALVDFREADLRHKDERQDDTPERAGTPAP